MKLKIGYDYQTRGGGKVTLLGMTMCENRTGVILECVLNGSIVKHLQIVGKPEPRDLVKKWEDPITVVYYINVYRGRVSKVFPTLHEAERARGKTAIDTICIEKTVPANVR